MSTHIWHLISPSLEKYHKNTAWICRQKHGKTQLTYQQIYEASLTTTCQLRRRGVKENDTIAVIAPNGPQWTIAALACWRLGVAIAPIHVGSSDYEINTQIKAISPQYILVHKNSLPLKNTIEISLSADSLVVEEEKRQPIAGNSQSVAARIYTSGSTGLAKIVKLSHNNLTSNALAAYRVTTLGEKDRFISLLPFSHTMGLLANVILPYYCGSSLILPRILASSEILQTLSEEKITVIVAVPRLFRNIMQELEKKFNNHRLLKLYVQFIKKVPLSVKQTINAPIRNKLGGNINAWVSGGSHLDMNICKYFHDLGIPLRQGYGLTETSPLVSIQKEFDDAVGSVGKPIETTQVKIHQADANGRGEIWVKGPNVMIGYEDPQQMAQSFDNGWFKTGDVGTLDPQGRIVLTGRLKRLIITEAGKNVYPEELETLLERNPGIKEAGVFELHMKPVCVLAIEGENAKQLARQCIESFNALVSSHNRISDFAIVDELPRTSLGKISFKQLPIVFSANVHK